MTTVTTCAEAARVGDLQLLIRLHEEGKEWDVYTCANAALNGHLECLKYAHEHGCEWDRWTCCDAAAGGKLECLKYAHEHGCPWDTFTCSNAAKNGHLDCLQYAHEHGCLWDEKTCLVSALSGRLECLKYAHEHGCEWNVYTCAAAARTEYGFECFQYLYQAWSQSHTLQSFWDPEYDSRLVTKINLDDAWWRQALFDVDLSSQLALQARVQAKKQEIHEIKLHTEASLKDELVLAVIQHYIHSYI